MTLCMEWDIKMGNSSMVTYKECKLYPLVIDCGELCSILIIIEGESYEVIFSKDWLSTFHSIINYRRRRLIF